MLQVVCKNRWEELALTDESHGTQTVLVFFRGIGKHLNKNSHFIVHRHFQTLQTVLSKGQERLCLHLQENDFVFKGKSFFFFKVLNKKAKAEMNYKVVHRSLAVKSQRRVS